jgi:chromosome partitioning protein
MRTLALVTQKGGSGKSTLAQGLAVAAIEDGEKVFVLELDKQGTTSNWAVRRTNPEPGVDRVTSGAELEKALVTLEREGYTLVVIDPPGTDSVAVTAAIRASSLCLIPMQPTPADLEAPGPTIETLMRLGRTTSDFAFVLNRSPIRSYRLTEAATALTKLGVLAQPYIAARNDHQDAMGAGLGVTEFAPEGKAAEEIRALWAWAKRKMRLQGSRDGKRAINE